MHLGKHKSGVNFNCLMISLISLASFKGRGEQKWENRKGANKQQKMISKRQQSLGYILKKFLSH